MIQLCQDINLKAASHDFDGSVRAQIFLKKIILVIMS